LAASTKPTFFATPADFRRWLEKHHARSGELLVGFHKRETGRASITWPESVDEALCFGWIDGLRRSLGDEAYTIRFTPRKAKSKWSAVNIKRVAVLEREGRMQDAGRAAFAARVIERAGYAHEERPAGLPAAAEEQLRRKAKAARFWDAQTPSYRRLAAHWVTNAKRQETRASRLATLIDCCAAYEPIPPMKFATTKPKLPR
jgi:uncharacterized protein YdeI (YjbR/CyaY-like superfamily)